MGAYLHSLCSWVRPMFQQQPHTLSVVVGHRKVQGAQARHARLVQQAVGRAKAGGEETTGEGSGQWGQRKGQAVAWATVAGAACMGREAVSDHVAASLTASHLKGWRTGHAGGPGQKLCLAFLNLQAPIQWSATSTEPCPVWTPRLAAATWQPAAASWPEHFKPGFRPQPLSRDTSKDIAHINDQEIISLLILTF